MEDDFGPHVLLDSIDQHVNPPSSPDFHGFGPETVIPGELVLETEGEGEDEQVVKVFRKHGLAGQEEEGKGNQVPSVSATLLLSQGSHL